MVVVYKIDRLTRALIDFAKIVAVLDNGKRREPLPDKAAQPEGSQQMPVKKGNELKDPVGAISRAIVRIGSDFRYGKPGTDDFVRAAVRLLDLEPDDDRDEKIADELFEDAGEKYSTEQQMATFIYARLTAS